MEECWTFLNIAFWSNFAVCFPQLTTLLWTVNLHISTQSVTVLLSNNFTMWMTKAHALLYLLLSQIHLPHVMSKSPCTQIVVTGHDKVTTFQRTAVSLSSWEEAKLYPTLESNPVTCANRCLQMRAMDVQSCNSLTFDPSTGQCHLGTVDPSGGSQSTYVMMIKPGKGYTSGLG